MSSLRLALKQSLAETGHLAIHDKNKRKHNAASRDPDRKRKTSKRKLSSSNKNVGKRKKYFTSDLTERSIKKEHGQFSAELGKGSMSSVSDSSSFPNATDTNGHSNMPAGLQADADLAACDDGCSLSSNEASSYSDSDTVTNTSSCCSHRHQHRMHSSEDEDSSNNSQNETDGMQEDMAGVFDNEGTSADESHAPNSTLVSPHFDLQQQHLQQHGCNALQQQHLSPRKKKRKKKKDKGKRRKDRQRLSSGQGEEHESPEHVNENESRNERSHDGVDAQSKLSNINVQIPAALHDGVSEPRPHLSRRPSLKLKASKQMVTVKQPNPDVLDWVSGMSQGKQRRKIQVGMRVKVCFEFKSDDMDSDGNIVRYYRWCGGGVTHVGLEGKEIRILYDDGTLEDTGFPDREIVVDDNGNGKHQVPVDAFLPKQPSLLMTMNEANQDNDLDDEMVKSESFGNNDEQENTPENLPLNEGFTDAGAETLHSNILKSVKVEYTEENNAVRLHADSPNGVKSGVSKISQESSISHSSNIPESSETVALFKSETGTVCNNTNECMSSPSWGSNNSGRLNHQSGSESSPSLANASVGVAVQDMSSARASKKIKLKRRKLSSPNNCDSNRMRNSGLDSTMENDNANSASNNATRPENCMPSLKIRLKSKSIKHRKRVDNTGSTCSPPEESDVTKIKIKCDPDGSNTTESWPSAMPTPSNLNEVRTHKSGKPLVYAQGDSAWLGDDEGQGIKRSSSELEEASESENDVAMLTKVSTKVPTGSKPNLTCGNFDLDRAVSPNSSENTPKAFGNDNSNTPVINFLFKGRKPSTEEKANRKDASTKSNNLPPVSSEQVAEASTDGMPKKKKQRAHSPGISSHRSSSVRSPRQSKVSRAEGQTGNYSSSPVHENQGAVGKKRQKEKQPSEQTVARTHDLNSKESTKYAKDNPTQCNGVGPDFGTKLPNESFQPGHTVRSGRKVAKTSKQRTSGKDEPAIRDASTKSKRKNKGKNGIIHRSMKEVDREDNSEIDNWVQCKSCSKWRCIPNSVDMESLPEHWYCKDNPDLSRNTCEAPEQTQEEVAREKKMKNAVGDKNIPNRSKAQSPLTVQNKRSLTQQRSTDKFIKDPTPSKPIVGNNVMVMDDTHFDMMGSINGTMQYDSAVTNKSTSSDLFDEHTSEVQMTPDTPSGGEIDGTGSDGTVASALPTNKNMKGSNRKNRKGKGDEKEKKGSKGKKQKEAVSQEWVQCEKCEKWRRLPPRVKAKDLPDVWTCDMNDWDPRSASCAVQEDHKVDKAINPDKDIIGKDGLNSGVQTNKLSYRNLIRIPNRTISERTRAADSLFSSCATDPDKPPTVLYANSSAFQHKGGMHKSLEEDQETVSLLEYMRHSELWKDLYHYTLQPTCTKSEKFETLVHKSNPQTDKCNLKSMKAMIYYALGTQKFATHDVLLECQCREWDDLRWIDLRSSCTLESVQVALDELVKDGLVEALSSYPNLDGVTFGKITYCRVCTGGNDSHIGVTNTQASKARSRCMKISKPWKYSGLDAGF